MPRTIIIYNFQVKPFNKSSLNMPRAIIIYNFQVKSFNKSLLNMPRAIIRNINFQVKS